MRLNERVTLCLSFVLICFFATTGFCDSSFDRELIVKDQTRARQVEAVFKELMGAYEDEDAQGFLALVSDERFRQDYITFTDALYSDFRNYEIHQVDYWIDRIVPDHIKQFLYVRWEKRYENLDDGQQLTQKGFSRFLFDEVDGDYLLVELAGNHLFGGSLEEWREEVPVISGQETVMDDSGDQPDPEGLPDLLILDAKQEYVSPDEVLSFVVQNNGVAPSAPCTLEARPLYSAPMGYTYPIPALAPGETYFAEILNVPTMEYLDVDSNDVVVEEIENNNSYTLPGLP